MSETVITVDGVGKRYRIGLQEKKHDTLAGQMASWVKYPIKNFKNLKKLSSFKDGENAEDIVWALKDISFEVKMGEVLGIIGHNGAGKSTLLKILSRITDPSVGQIEIRGRVSSLLEVGTGFHPELTGRENVYMNGTILGMTKKEIDSKFDEIVDFSGISKYIDTPVKRYSSGMKVRLAFSVAAYLEPEILVIDEVLAVGDVAFQKKCMGKMEDVAGSGRTVLFVSHNMGAVKRLCTRSILLKGGRLVHEGSTDSVIDKYLNLNLLDGRRVKIDKNLDKPIVIKEVAVTCPNKTDNQQLEYSDKLNIELLVDVNEDIRGTNIGLTLSSEGVILFRSWDIDDNNDLFELRKKGSYKFVIPIPENILNIGRYSISLSAGQPNVTRYYAYPDIVTFELENLSNDIGSKSISRGGILTLPIQWNVDKL